MAARKTVTVAELKEAVNRMLATPDSTLWMKAPGKDRDMTAEEAFRMGGASLLEQVLHMTGNYKGFGYQDGQVTWAGGEPGSGEAQVGDETRRVYY